jgi:hypothetical protein
MPFARLVNDGLNNHARWLHFVVFYVVLANLPFWVTSRWLGLQCNGLFCLDYAAVGLLALFVPQIAATALLLLVIAADLICGVSDTYYLSFAECLTNITSLRGLSAPRLLAVVGIVVLTLLVSAVAASDLVSPIRANRSRAAGCVIAFAAVCLVSDCITVVRRTGRIPNPLRSGPPLDDGIKLTYFTELRLSRIPIIRFIHAEIQSAELRNVDNAVRFGALPVPSAAALAIHSSALAVGKDGSQKMPNIALILVESWGISNDSSVRNMLLQPYAKPDILARYEVYQGTVPFYGPTVAGEARELCGSKMGFHLLDASAHELESCLPYRLAALSYHSIALHGMDGHMFRRMKWYSAIGFQERWFREQFQQQGLPNCVGAFIGTCDAAVAEWIGRRLERQDANPNFVYWVTLNSHLPVPTPAPLPAAGTICSLSPPLSQQPALCSWYQLIANVHHSVSQLAMAQLARPTVFVIVGDHAPPFASPALRGLFSSAVVPYVLLIPRPETPHLYQVGN